MWYTMIMKNWRLENETKDKADYIILYYHICAGDIAALAMCGFRYFQLRDIANTYQVEDGNISYLTNTVQMWNRVTKDSCQKLLDTAESDPDKFLDMKYLMQVNETLQEKNSYLIVMRDNEEVYVGTNDLNTVPENLPDYMDTKTGERPAISLTVINRK